MAPEQPMSDMSEQQTPLVTIGSSKKTMPIKILAGVLGVAAIGVGAYFMMTQSAKPVTPEAVIARMMENMGGVTSVEFSGKIDADLIASKNPLKSLENFGQEPVDAEESAEGEPIVMGVGVAGSIGRADGTSLPQANVTFSFTSPDFPSGQSAEVETRSIEGVNYFKINKIPVIGELNLSALTQMWVNLDMKALRDSFSTSSEDVEVEKKDTFSAKTKEEIRARIAKAPLFQVVADQGKTEVNNVSVYQYQVAVNEAEAMQLYRDVSMLVDGVPLTVEEEKEMTDFWNSAEFKNAQILIGAKDFYLHGISFDLAVDMTEEEKTQGTLAVDFQMKNYNKPVMVEVPADTRTIVDFVGQVFGVILTQSFNAASFSELSEDGMMK